jgi:Zn-finger nucleic acid-binding protein
MPSATIDASASTTMQHTCPHHGGVLSRFQFRGHVLWRCLRCAGVWLPGPLVAAVAGSKPNWPARAAAAASTLRCPEDGRALQVVRAGAVELDWCAHCHGVWLDQGELAAIATQQAAHAKPADDARPLADLAEEGVDAGIEVAGRWIGRAGKPVPRPSLAAADAVEVAAAKPPPLPSLMPASVDAEGQPFAVELDAVSAVGDGAELGGGLLDATGEIAGQLLEGALSLVGEIFSGL